MTHEKLKELCHNCFTGMAMTGKLSNDGFLATLASIVYVLKDSKQITEDQKEDFIISFFDDYNKYATPPMEKKYIQEVLVPHILQIDTIDINEACFYIENSQH